ncbi:amino acid ABC transporter ATP-binding protein [Komagataeibacter sp. FNDCF1]|uniref:amino acid ABC transporter ATP-binding protein n=1 Tax=Komagataeibacter sp. FNDCF1 TaxID=2878681 RepID=UPI00351CFC2B
MLDLEGVCRKVGDTVLLDECAFSLPAGQTAVLVGPSGAGKSTLLRCINLLAPADRGRIVFDGRDIMAPGVDAPGVRRDIGMVFQNFELFDHMTVLENIMLAPMHVRGMSRARARDLAMSLLEKVHLPHRADALPSGLSGGQQQRAAIARALAMQPRLMLYDEPTSALDPEMTGEVLTVMSDLAAEGMASVVVTHEMGFARRVADRIVFMQAGQVVEEAASADFFAGNCSARAQRFLERVMD